MNSQETSLIRLAIPADMDAIKLLLPRLAEFELPPGRASRELWRGDLEMFLQWASGQRADLSVFVAQQQGLEIAGLAAVSLRDDLISGKPSAHLEVLVINKSAEGQGLGTRLIQRVEEHSKNSGALNLTLTVFATNQRARKLYEKSGLEAETMRYNKWFA